MTSCLKHFRDVHYENALDDTYWEQYLNDENLEAWRLFCERMMKDILNHKGYTAKARRKFKKAKHFMVKYGIWKIFHDQYANFIDDEDMANAPSLSRRQKCRIIGKLLNLLMKSNDCEEIAQDIISQTIIALLQQYPNIQQNLHVIFEPLITNKIQEQLNEWRYSEQRVIQEAFQRKTDMISQRKCINARISVCVCDFIETYIIKIMLIIKTQANTR